MDKCIVYLAIISSLGGIGTEAKDLIFDNYTSTRNCIVENGKVQVVQVNMENLRPWTKAAVDMHNRLRELHGSPPLVLNPDLCRSAQWKANLLYDSGRQRSNINNFSNEDLVNQCGENLWISQMPFKSKDGKNVSPVPATLPITEWYTQVRHYKYLEINTDPDNLDQVRKFTQMIWKDTKEIGVGYALNKSGGYAYFVAHYYPPGNVHLKFSENVFPTRAGLGSKPKSSAGQVNANSNSIVAAYGLLFLLVAAF